MSQKDENEFIAELHRRMNAAGTCPVCRSAVLHKFRRELKWVVRKQKAARIAGNVADVMMFAGFATVCFAGTWWASTVSGELFVVAYLFAAAATWLQLTLLGGSSHSHIRNVHMAWCWPVAQLGLLSGVAKWATERGES
jgi:hypothetical protein